MPPTAWKQCGALGRPRWGLGSQAAKAAPSPSRRTKGAAGPAPEPGKVCERLGPRPARAAPHNGPAERGKAERHAPAPQGRGPVPGACPSRRLRPLLARRGRSSCSRTGSGRAGSAASTSSAPATRTPGSGTASPPTVSSGGRDRQLGSPPGPSPGGGGGAAASGHRRRRRRSSSHRRLVARAAPFGAEAGGGRNSRRAAFSRPRRPFPARNANDPRAGFHPVHLQSQEGRSPCPMSRDWEAREVGERACTFSMAPPGLIMVEDRGDFLKGCLESCRSEEGPAGLPVFPCLSISN